ncbi:MAG: anthranilate synthase component I, partial [Acidimicrobiales bacterium]
MSRNTLLVRRLIGDIETPVGVMLKLGADQPGTVLFESVAGGHQLDRFSFIGLEPQLWFRITDGKAETDTDHRFLTATTIDKTPLEALRWWVDHALAECTDELPPMASGAFGYIGYDMIQHVEPIPMDNPNDLGVPEVLMMIPRAVIIFDHLYQELILVGRVIDDDTATADELLDTVEARLRIASPPTTACKTTGPVKHDLNSNTSVNEFLAMVARSQEYILAGDIFQVVPSQRLSTRFDLKSISLYRALRHLNPSAFMFHMNLGEVTLVGSSPEILVRVRDDRVAIRPLAGTRPCSGDKVEDQRRAEDLLADEKELAEHLMLLDLGRNDVGRVAEYGSVEVTEQFIVEHYSHVMHIVSHVEGQLRPGLDAVDALFAGFPAGTVSGAPKIRAMQIIDELEISRRGVYGGAIGYFGWNGDLDTCIALRTAIIKDGWLHIQAGGGVVLDSDPEYEFDETMHKAQALIDAADLSARYEV